MRQSRMKKNHPEYVKKMTQEPIETEQTNNDETDDDLFLSKEDKLSFQQWVNEQQHKEKNDTHLSTFSSKKTGRINRFLNRGIIIQIVLLIIILYIAFSK